MVVSCQKNTKSKGITFQCPPFKLGYHASNAIACEKNESLESTYLVGELVKKAIVHDEA